MLPYSIQDSLQRLRICKWSELLLTLLLSAVLIGPSRSDAGEPFESCAAAVFRQNCLLIPGDGAQVHFRVTQDGEPIEFEFGYMLVDDPEGAIIKSRFNIGRRHLRLTPDGHPDRLLADTPAFLDYLVDDGNAVCVVNRRQSNNRCFNTDKLLIPGDRWLAWYLVPSADLNWCRYCAPEDRPPICTSVDKVRQEGFGVVRCLPASENHAPKLMFELSSLNWDQAERVLEQRVDANSKGKVDLPCRTQVAIEIFMEPLAMEDTYAVFPSGEDFQGPPHELTVAGTSQHGEGNCGLLYNDCSFNGRPLTITHCRVETPGLADPALENGPWHELILSDTLINGELTRGELASCTITADKRVHGTLSLFADGAFSYKPKFGDPYWGQQATEPLPITIQYRLSDGISDAIGRMFIGHGYYHRGETIDNQCHGERMVFLAGGGDGRHYLKGRRRFFGQSSAGRDIVLIAQASENQEFADRVFENFADGKARSITSLCITTRAQAQDPRIARLLEGADVIWLGGGSQSTYNDFWKDTPLLGALNAQVEKGASVGATSSGTAILGQAAYINLPWDSVTSSVVLRNPQDTRNRVLLHTNLNFPMSALSSEVGSPLHGYLVDTHFVEADRFGRLGVFVAQNPPMKGLGIDASTALLISQKDGQCRWDVYGLGAVYVIEGSTDLVNAPSKTTNFGVIADAISYVRIDNGQSVEPKELARQAKHSVQFDGNVLYRLGKEHLYFREP